MLTGRAGTACASRRSRDPERGSVTVFTAVFAVAVVVLLALIIDGGVALSARQRAADIAGQAARAAADTLDVTALRTRGVAVIGPGACLAAARLVVLYAERLQSGVDRVTSAAMVRCVAAPGSDVATVRVTVSTTPLVPGILSGFHETGQASAATECGIQQGGVC